MVVVMFELCDIRITDREGYFNSKVRSCRHKSKGAAVDNIKFEPQLCGEPFMLGCKVYSVSFCAPNEWCREQFFECVLGPAAEAEC